MAAKITLYFDIVSPFAWLAFYMLRHSPAFRSVDVTYTPIFLGGLMKACDNRPPIQIKNKATWINLERERWAKSFNIPCATTAPEGFPVNTILPQRALTAIALQKPEKLADAIEAVYMAFWGPESNAKGIHKPEGLVGVLAGVLGQQAAEEVVKGAGADEVKKSLSAATDAAFNAGAFGLPWFVCERDGKTEAYWGFDHLGQVMDFCGVEREKFGAAQRSLL